MLEAPNNADLPWMVNAPLKEWIKFSVKQQSVVKTENEKGWSCYIAEMEFPGEQYEDGDHEIPFWAMVPFFDAYTEADKEKGKQMYRYKRTEQVGKKNFCEIEVF